MEKCPRMIRIEAFWEAGATDASGTGVAANGSMSKGPLNHYKVDYRGWVHNSY